MFGTWRVRVAVFGSLLTGIAIGAVGWVLVSPLFIDRIVDESFPTPPAVRSVPTPAELTAMTAVSREARRDDILAAARGGADHEMKESMPDAAASDGPVKLLEGRFADADRIHKGQGTASLYRLADGSHVLRFEDFRVTNGPDLRVILSAHPNPTSGEEVHQGFLDLGPLKGNFGNQNYTLPANADASRFRSVIVYCRAFSVIFSVAPLSADNA